MWSLNRCSLHREHFYSIFAPCPSLLKSFPLLTLAHPWDLSWSTTLSREPVWASRRGRPLATCSNSAVDLPASRFYQCILHAFVRLSGLCFPTQWELCEGHNLISRYPWGLKQHSSHNRHSIICRRKEGINDVLNPELWKIYLSAQRWAPATDLCRRLQRKEVTETEAQCVCNLDLVVFRKPLYKSVVGNLNTFSYRCSETNCI